jgi:hypothetical protein
MGAGGAGDASVAQASNVDPSQAQPHGDAARLLGPRFIGPLSRTNGPFGMWRVGRSASPVMHLAPERSIPGWSFGVVRCARDGNGLESAAWRSPKIDGSE